MCVPEASTVIAASVDPGMVIVRDKLFEHIVGDLYLLYILNQHKSLWKILHFSAAVIALSVKPLYRNCSWYTLQACMVTLTYLFHSSEFDRILTTPACMSGLEIS